MASQTDRVESTVELGPIHDNLASKEEDPFLVSFTEPFDPENPKDWRTGRKWAVTDVLSATGFNRIMVSTIMAPALPMIAAELNMNSTESAMALSVYLLATAFGPLVIAPLSEVYGRKPILHASNIWFLGLNLACGFATNKSMLIAFRFLAGFGASAVYVLANGVLGDLWRPEQRGSSLSIYLLIPLLGAAIGPIIGGFIVANTSWRWIFWSSSIFQAFLVLMSFTAFQESYEPLILRRRAARLRTETGNPQYYTLDEKLHADKSPVKIVGAALLRPLRLLLFYPVIQIASLIAAFNYGLLYIVLSTFSELWTKQYHESVEISGLHYIAVALGEIFGAQLCGRLMDKLYHRLKSRTGGEHSPELRMVSIFPGTVIVPLGLFLYGWAAQYHIHWAVVDLGAFIALLGMQAASIPIQAYIMECYPTHTSSAAAASQFLRSLTAFAFPLFAPTMYEVLGYGWGNSTIAFSALFVGIPAPLVLIYWGAKLRVRERVIK